MDEQMIVYVLMNTFDGDARIEGVISDKAIADKWAEGRGNWFEVMGVDACLTDNLAYLARHTPVDVHVSGHAEIPDGSYIATYLGDGVWQIESAGKTCRISTRHLTDSEGNTLLENGKGDFPWQDLRECGLSLRLHWR